VPAPPRFNALKCESQLQIKKRLGFVKPLEPVDLLALTFVYRGSRIKAIKTFCYHETSILALVVERIPLDILEIKETVTILVCYPLEGTALGAPPLSL
jgi:hypothetical protein